MHKKTKSSLRFFFLSILVLMVLSVSSCTKVEPRGSSCKYLVKLLGDKEKRHAIEDWLEDIFDNPDGWQEPDGKKFRGMGAFYIAIPDISRLEEMGLPEHTQLLASKDTDGNVTRVVAAVAQWVGIIFSKDKHLIEFETIPKNRGEKMGILCLERD